MTTKISTKDWRNLPIERWNVTSFHSYLSDETKRRYDAEYVPGGRGSKSQRWMVEKGMIKNEIKRRGPEVVRKFIEICWREYRTSNAKRFPYPTFGFAISYMDHHWTEAERAAESDEIAERASLADTENIDEEWF